MSASAISKKKKPAETIAVCNTNNLIHVNTSNLMKFTAGNFLMWCRQIHALFDGYGLAGYLDGTVTVPTQTLTVDNVITLNPAFTFWRRQDKLVYSAVLGSISTTFQQLVSGATTASELWSTLKSSNAYFYGMPRFGPIPGRQHQVKQGKEGTRSNDEYLQRLTTLFDKLTLLGKIVGLEDQLDQILEGLTTDLNNLSLHQPYGLSGPQISHIGSTSLSTPSSSNLFPMAQKVKAKGGIGGKVWDDGVHEGVSQIYIQEGDTGGIASIKFDYVKNSKPIAGSTLWFSSGSFTELEYETIAGSTHGDSSRSFTESFDLNPICDEYILSVKCYYDEGEIQGLVIDTNIMTSACMGYNIGTTFELKVSGKKIVGFHGSFDKKLISLGAYFAPLSPDNLLDYESRKKDRKKDKKREKKMKKKKDFLDHDSQA